MKRYLQIVANSYLPLKCDRGMDNLRNEQTMVGSFFTIRGRRFFVTPQRLLTIPILDILLRGFILREPTTPAVK